MESIWSWIFYLAFLLFIITATYASIKGAPWFPTNKKNVKRFLELAEIKEEEKLYDLGCGDGRIIFASAKKGAFVEGIEVSLFMYLLTSFKKLFQKEKKNIKVSYKDMWEKNIKDADVVYFFLMPAIYSRLKEKLEKELKEGTKVIAYVWPIKGWEPVKISKKEGEPNIYLYKR